MEFTRAAQVATVIAFPLLHDEITKLDMLEFMFPSINRSSPVPAELMQPQTRMIPPQCLTVGKTQFFFTPFTPQKGASTHAAHNLSQTI